MKKTYISPAALTVQLSTCHMMAESIVIITESTGSDDDTITDGSQVLTKESKSIWDNEW